MTPCQCNKLFFVSPSPSHSKSAKLSYPPFWFGSCSCPFACLYLGYAIRCRYKHAYIQTLRSKVVNGVGHTFFCSSCVGGFARSQSVTSTERTSRRSFKKRKVGGLYTLKRDWWSTSPEAMENASNAHLSQRNTSIGSASQAEEAQTSNNNANNVPFVNHALILWNERRREWVRSRPQTRSQMPREPVIRNSNMTIVSDGDRHDLDNGWNATYDDLLATNQPFPQPVPLPEMIDFLVDVWHEEGLYD